MTKVDSNTPVDVDTDDLDKFEDLFYNRTPVEEKAEPEPEVDENVEEPVETPEVDDQDGEVDTPADPEEDELEEEEVEEPAPKVKKQTFQDRINELTAKTRTAERDRDDLLRKFNELQAAVEKAKVPEAPVKASRPVFEADAPQPDALDEAGEDVYPLGEFDPNFIRDLTAYTIDKETKRANTEREVAEATKAKEVAFEALSTDWNAKIDEVAKELPDVREKITVLDETFADLPEAYGEYLATTIMSLDHGPELLYYFSQNIGEAQKIVASGATAATLALGRLDAQFAKPKVESDPKPKVKVSEAAEPPVNRSRGSKGSFSISADTDNLDDFEKVFFNKK